MTKSNGIMYNKRESLMLFSFLNIMIEKKYIGIINHNFANKNLNEMIGMELLMLVINIQTIYMIIARLTGWSIYSFLIPDPEINFNISMADKIIIKPSVGSDKSNGKSK